jgi:plastocyanin
MRNIAFVAAALLVLSYPANATEHEVRQKDNAFSTGDLKIKVGDAISFRNDDPYQHDLFSASDAQPFELGSYAGGQAKSVIFRKEGHVEVQCLIHPDMKMTVDVAK